MKPAEAHPPFATWPRGPKRVGARRAFEKLVACALASACLVLGGVSLASAESDSLVEPKNMPGPLKQVEVEQRLGETLPLDASLIDEDGRQVTLGDFYGERPVILAFVYYECPMLCSLILNGTATSLGILKFTPGEEFDVVAISVDPDETPAMATESKASTLQRYGREGTEDGWHFLTGDDETVRRIADAAGFGYEYLPATDEYAHASAIMVTTPEGVLSQYFYGVEYPPKDLRLALVEASSNKIGSVVDQILLYCYRYDPQIGKYTAMTMRILRLTGAAFVVGLIIFLWIAFRRDRSANDTRTRTLGAA